MAPSPLSGGDVRLSSELYPRSCVEAAAEAFRAHLTIVHAAGSGPDVFRVEIDAGITDDPVRVRREFLNYLLDLVVQRHLSP